MSEIRGVTEAQARAATPNRGWLHGYVKWAGGACDANIAYHLIGGLTVLAQSVPIDYNVPFGALPIYSTLFGLVVGDSTDARKSTAVKLAEKILKASIPDRIGAEPGSAEAIVDELFYNPQQIVFISEYGSILASAERGYATAIKTKWTHAYDCVKMARVKANKKGVVVENPRLSIFAGVAPGYIERHTEPVDWTEGFLGRHTTILANRERLLKKPVADQTLEDSLVTWLKGVVATDAYSQNSEIGPCLGLSDDAAQLQGEFDEYLASVGRSGRNRMIAPALSRASTMAIKIAGLLAWDWGIPRLGGSWYVGEEEITAAIKIVQLHVQSVMEIGAWLAPDKSMRDRRKVLSLINGVPVRRGHVMREAQLLKRDFDNVIGTLIDEGTVRIDAVDGEPYYVLAPERSAHERPARPTDPQPEDDPPPDYGFDDAAPPPNDAEVEEFDPAAFD